MENKMHEWYVVDTYHQELGAMYRMPVPGGWLYLHRFFNGKRDTFTTTFVPEVKDGRE